ncbi:hypothetical protein SDC9_85449 [bioreactor metagenome]|uniref:Pit accessory protein n=1 Tax=bioreactor metagenome TaxID=1076179 RepID=A0A644ZDJ1_9ZZZZ
MGKMGRKQVDCFGMFEHGITISRDAAVMLQKAFSDGSIDLSELKLVKELEHDGDRHIHESLRAIDDAFITPIEREDIVNILNGIENITDSVEAIADHIYMMNIDKANHYLRKFIDLTVESCQRLHELMIALKGFKKDRKRLMELIIEVNRLEEEGDRTYSESMRELFERESNPVTIIKHKELYQLSETAIDRCEDVADMVERAMIYNS